MLENLVCVEFVIISHEDRIAGLHFAVKEPVVYFACEKRLAWEIWKLKEPFEMDTVGGRVIFLHFLSLCLKTSKRWSSTSIL